MNIKSLLGFSLAMVPVTALVLSGKPEKSKPNVIFILLDDFGYTDLGCYGSKFYETPNVDRLAREGIRFTNAYAACPVSSPTRASIMTGKYPVNTGITDWIPGRQATNSGLPDDKLRALPFKQQLDLNEVTIAEVLKKNGYSTMISGKWHLGRDEEFWPENQGFDVNRGGHAAGAPARNKTSNGYFSPYGNPRLEDGPEGEYLTDRQTDEAIKFIGEKKDKPFFVYLSYYAVHNPMQAKEEFVQKFSAKADSMGLTHAQSFTRDKEWIRKSMSDNYKERIIQSNPVYAAMIRSVDENLGRLFDKIKELGIDRNTFIIFTSDNGGLSTSEGSPTCNTPLRAGKGWLYEGGIRVPLIIKVPEKKNKFQEIASPVSSIDFFPTIIDLTDSEKPKARNDGISLVPLMKTGKMKERPLYWHYPHYSNQGVEPGSAIRLGKYKLIDNFERGRQELYDLELDISEKRDISNVMPEKARELYLLLNEWRSKTGAKMMESNPNWNGF
ncbi:MAG TPA: sulfatase [Bacteroidales bacterium]|nr:sulfatase [Bacteroidales bacterium]